MKDLLRERTRTLENETDAKRRAVENYESMKRKYDLSLEKDSGKELLDNYKQLLKCSSCNSEFKSHCIMTCMHVFCKKCVDTTIAARQRKCPSCLVPFSKTDVRQIYL
ncbi:E3 ubiquitin-protein ligase bre1 [Nowakowskiella sp. JEL0078]|nr:E3 ubiquitin-protein ligase bre1 [Nowakowskiella sp. JEL0078]